MMDDFELNDVDAQEMEALLAAAEEEEHYADPGPKGYDPGHEDEVRSLMELTSFYDEAGPRSDPEGKYLCGSCQLRKGDDACLFVSGAINRETGSCNIFICGNALPVSYELKEKYTQIEAGYAERPKEKGFGCSRCEYGAKAKAPDNDGRPSWCIEWGVHVEPSACCGRHDGDDMVLAPGEKK